MNKLFRCLIAFSLVVDIQFVYELFDKLCRQTCLNCADKLLTDVITYRSYLAVWVIVHKFVELSRTIGKRNSVML